NPEVPWELEAIALKAMEKKKENRYASARAMADDVIRYMRGELIQARSMPLGLRLRKKLARHRTVAILSGAPPAVVIALAVVLAMGLGGGGGRGASAQKVRELVEKSRAAERGSKLDEACDVIRAALTLAPGDEALAARLEQLEARI